MCMPEEARGRCQMSCFSVSALFPCWTLNLEFAGFWLAWLASDPLFPPATYSTRVTGVHVWPSVLQGAGYPGLGTRSCPATCLSPLHCNFLQLSSFSGLSLLGNRLCLLAQHFLFKILGQKILVEDTDRSQELVAQGWEWCVKPSTPSVGVCDGARHHLSCQTSQKSLLSSLCASAILPDCESRLYLSTASEHAAHLCLWSSVFMNFIYCWENLFLMQFFLNPLLFNDNVFFNLRKLLLFYLL